MTYFLVISCVVSGWAMLRLMGGERVQMIKKLEADLKKEQEKAAAAASEVPISPEATPAEGSQTPASKAPAASKSKH